MRKCAVGLLLVFCAMAGYANDVPPADTVKDINLLYRTRHELLIVPAVINGNIHINLIVDPRFHSVVLFGNRFRKILKRSGKKADRDGDQHVWLSNNIDIGPASMTDIPIVVVPNKDIRNFVTGVHGIIGADIFANFEILFDRKNGTLRLAPSEKAHARNISAAKPD